MHQPHFLILMLTYYVLQHSDLLLQIASAIHRQLHIRLFNTPGGGGRNRIVRCQQSRLVVSHLLVPLLDLCGFTQIAGPTKRLYTDAVLSTAFDRTHHPFSKILVFRTASLTSLKQLFSHRAMTRKICFIRRVWYFDGLSPWNRSVSDVRSEVLRRVPREDTSRSFKDEMCSILDEKNVQEMYGSSSSVKACTHVCVNRESPFTLFIRPSGKGNCIVTVKFSVQGKRRNNPNNRNFAEAWHPT